MQYSFNYQVNGTAEAETLMEARALVEKSINADQAEGVNITSHVATVAPNPQYGLGGQYDPRMVQAQSNAPRPGMISHP